MYFDDIYNIRVRLAAVTLLTSWTRLGVYSTSVVNYVFLTQPVAHSASYSKSTRALTLKSKRP